MPRTEIHGDQIKDKTLTEDDYDDNSIPEVKLKISNTPSDGQTLSWDNDNTIMKWSNTLWSDDGTRLIPSKPVLMNKTGTATVDTQYPSQDFILKCSVWDSTNSWAEDRITTLRLIAGSGIHGSEPYKLSILDNSDAIIFSLDILNKRLGVGIITPLSGFHLGSGTPDVVTTSNDAYITGKLEVDTDTYSNRFFSMSNSFFNEYIYHYADTDTYLQFGSDNLTLSAGGFTGFYLNNTKVWLKHTDLRKTGTATVGVQYSSNTLSFVGSVWDTTLSQAEDRKMYVKLNAGSGPNGSEPYYFSLYNNSDVEVIRFDALNSRLGILKTDPTHTLDISGDIRAIGTHGLIYSEGSSSGRFRLTHSGASSDFRNYEIAVKDNLFKINRMTNDWSGESKVIISIDTNDYIGLNDRTTVMSQGTAKNNINALTIYNTINADDMDGTATSILFSQRAYGDSIQYDAGSIKIITEGDWTPTASTRSSSMAFNVVESGNIQERVRITSAGLFGLGTTQPIYKFHLNQSNVSGGDAMMINQADLDAAFIRISGQSKSDDNSYSLINASIFSVPGSLVGWLKVYIDDVSGGSPITDGYYYIPFYNSPTSP